MEDPLLLCGLETVRFFVDWRSECIPVQFLTRCTFRRVMRAKFLLHRRFWRLIPLGRRSPQDIDFTIALSTPLLWNRYLEGLMITFPAAESCGIYARLPFIVLGSVWLWRFAWWLIYCKESHIPLAIRKFNFSYVLRGQWIWYHEQKFKKFKFHIKFMERSSNFWIMKALEDKNLNLL